MRLYVIPLFAVVPSAFYTLGTVLDFPQRMLLPVVYAAAAFAAVLALWETLKAPRSGLISQYIVAIAFAVYFLALGLPAVLIAATVLPASNESSLPSILFDQASSILVYFGYIAMSSEKATHDLMYQATTDPLTKVANRRGGQPVLEQLYRRSLEGERCSVWLADIDYFKAVNDNFGHDAGDVVLAAVAHRLAFCLRRDDVLVRWGGEEFLIVLPNTSLAEGAASAERLRVAIEAEPVLLGRESLKVTLSLGGSEMSSTDETFESSLRRADKALYLAKEGGRNRVCCKPAEGARLWA